MEDTAAPLQRQKRSRVASEDDEAGDTGVAPRGSSRLAAGVDDGAVAAEKPETLFLFIQDEDEEAFMEEPEPDRTPHALREIDFFYVCPPDDGAADQQELADVALTVGGNKQGPREGAIDATLRLGLSAPSAPTAVAALGEDDDHLQLHSHGVPFSASPAAAPMLDPPLICYPLPFAADPYRVPPPSPATPEDCFASPEDGDVVVVPDDAFHSFVSTGYDGTVEFVTDNAVDRPSTVLDLNQPCSSEFSNYIAGDVDERLGQETAAEQRHRSSTPCTTFI